MPWLSRQVYQDQHDRAVRAEAIAGELKNHNTALQVTMDWQRVRLTQLEHERAQLIFNYMGVRVDVPHIEPAEKPRESGQTFDQPLSFDDVGDAMAKSMGLDWNSEGKVTQQGKVIS